MPLVWAFSSKSVVFQKKTVRFQEWIVTAIAETAINMGIPYPFFLKKKSLISQTENRHHPQITTQNRTQLKIEPKGQYHSPITVL